GELIGRSARFSPEVDGLVYVTGEAILGAIVPVRITAADTYDLYGEIV
ncbi:MAG: 30S ribosomal protein S12 methylthiotransferase RimO, partial [Microcystis sp.]